MSIILQMIRKPNSIIVLLLIQNNSQFKKKLKHAYLINVKFIVVSACLSACLGNKGLFRLTAGVVCRVVFCCSCYAFSKQFAYFLLLKQVKCSAMYQSQPRPQVFSVKISIIWQFCCTFHIIFYTSQNSSTFQSINQSINFI